MDVIDLTAAERAEQAQPTGYDRLNPTAEPPTRREAVEEVRLARIALRFGLLSPAHLDAILARAGRALAAGLAIVALAVVALVASPAPQASAAEAPQPDPTAYVASGVSVTLSAGAVSSSVTVTTTTTNRRGNHCASVFTPHTSMATSVGILGRACSRSATFVVPITLDSRTTPVGTSTLTVTDDLNPYGAPAVATLTARRPSRFGVGTWIPMLGGQIYVSAPLNAYTPARGAWTPQQNSPVYLQEYSAKRGRWSTKATLTTDAYGIATGVVYLGEGPHRLRVARPQGATVTATTGTARTFVLPCDPNIDTI